MKRRSGFTFLELLLAISLFAVGMLSVLQVFPLSRRYLSQSAMTTQAAFLAQEAIEALRAEPYSSLGAGTFEARHALGAGSEPLALFERQTVIGYVNPASNWTGSGSDTGIKKIDVTVYWRERSINRQFTLSTYASER